MLLQGSNLPRNPLLSFVVAIVVVGACSSDGAKTSQGVVAGGGGGGGGAGGESAAGAPGTGGSATSDRGTGGVSAGSGGRTGAGGMSSSAGAAGSGGLVGSGGASSIARGSGGQAGRVGGSGGTTTSGGGSAGTRDAGAVDAVGVVDAAARGGASGDTGWNGEPAGASGGDQGPCDIYAAATPPTPCMAAHSTVRALYGSYSGKLYQVRRESDSSTKDILTLAPGGYADTASQDTLCAGNAKCVLTVMYDQSGKGNDLWYQGSTEVPGSDVSIPANAMKESLTASGHKVYSLYIDPHVSYWRDGSKSGIPTGSQPEGLYMVTSGTHYNGGCCFDYGNSETTRKADAAGAMDAINFGSQCWFGGCSGTGPWVQADLEWGLFPGGSKTWNQNQKAFANKYVTAMLKNDGTKKFALKGGNAQSGTLSALYDGSLPSGYGPMVKQGAIVLGSGGDCCKPGGGANDSAGTFYEGAIVAGYPTDETDNAIQANIVAAGYGAASTP